MTTIDLRIDKNHLISGYRRCAMAIRDSIEALEQQIYVACSEGDYETVNQLEYQLEVLLSKADHPFDDESLLDDDKWR